MAPGGASLAADRPELLGVQRGRLPSTHEGRESLRPADLCGEDVGFATAVTGSPDFPRLDGVKNLASGRPGRRNRLPHLEFAKLGGAGGFACQAHLLALGAISAPRVCRTL